MKVMPFGSDLRNGLAMLRMQSVIFAQFERPMARTNSLKPFSSASVHSDLVVCHGWA